MVIYNAKQNKFPVSRFSKYDVGGQPLFIIIKSLLSLHVWFRVPLQHAAQVVNCQTFSAGHCRAVNSKLHVMP